MEKSSKPAKRLKIAAKKRTTTKGQAQPGNRPKKRKMRTGVSDEWGFFLGGESAVAGIMHYKPPRWTQEYEAMAVHQIVQRIVADIDELRARAYPTAPDEWAQKFAPARWKRYPFSYDLRLRNVIHETVAESLQPGLMARVRSPNGTVRDTAVKEYYGLLEKLLSQEPKSAAGALAFIGKQTAIYLENLYSKRPELMREVAAGCDLWPVNLGLKARTRKGVGKWALTRKDFAYRYIKGLNLNRACTSPTGHSGGAAEVSPITLAAESLYQKLLLLKASGFAFMEATSWAKKLLALPSPMTRGNSKRWWGLAKAYLYERWEKARDEFAPLERYLNLGPLDGQKYPYESRIKSRVIDDALKKSFQALAQPDL